MTIFFCRPAIIPVRGFIIISAFIVLGCTKSALAESTEVQALKMEIEMLKIKNAELVHKVQVLETLPTDRSVRGSKKTLKNPWQALVVNMSKDDVTSLLGKPGKVDKWKTGEAWYYPNIRGGEVDFDINGKVTGWLEP